MDIQPDYSNDNTLRPFSPSLDPPLPPAHWGRATCGPARPLDPVCTCGKTAPHVPHRTSHLHLRDNIGKVWWKGTDIYFTTTEMRVLRLLVDNRDAFVTYRAIYDVMRRPGFAAGEGDNGWRGNVRSAIKRIRKKFLAYDATFNCIVNLNAFGYSWIEV